MFPASPLQMHAYCCRVRTTWIEKYREKTRTHTQKPHPGRRNGKKIRFSYRYAPTLVLLFFFYYVCWSMKMRRRRGIGALFLWCVRIPDDDIRALLPIFPEPFSRTDGRQKSPPPSVPGRFAHSFPFICICTRVCDNNMYSQAVAGDRAMTIIIKKNKNINRTPGEE